MKKDEARKIAEQAAEKAVQKAQDFQPTTGAALKAAGIVLGVGMAAGLTLVYGMNKLMKDIFINEDWPDEEWSSDDWADEELEQ